MPVFGFSSFLKLLCSNERPQATQVKVRLAPKPGGYDYHRQMRLIAKQMLAGALDLEAALAEAASITKTSERKSAISSLNRLWEWKAKNPGEFLNFGKALYESPNKEFSVCFVPDFGMKIDGVSVAFAIWNNLTPPLIDRQVYAALSLFPRIYAGLDRAPEDLAVVSAQNSRVYRLGEQPDYTTMGALQVDRIESLFKESRNSLGISKPKTRDDSRKAPRSGPKPSKPA